MVVVLLLVVNMYILNSSFQRVLKLSQPGQGKQLGYCAHENKRESLTCNRNSRAKAGNINEAERDVGLGVLPRLAMHKYIANLQYIRNYRAAYKYTIQVAHAHPTMHRIH